MDYICIIDFGSQYTHLIARRIRECNVYTRIIQPSQKIPDKRNVKGIILSGGPASVYGKDSISVGKGLFACKVPILGICYGLQFITHYFQGGVKRSSVREYGKTRVEIDNTGPLFQGLKRREWVWMSHGDQISRLPSDFQKIASSESCEYVGIAHKSAPIYAIQFHPEVVHTPNGNTVLQNFLGMCRVRRNWNTEKYVRKIKNSIREKVGDRKVFLLLSGGVDSGVLFFLLTKTLGKKRVIGLHIDNGLMRKDESVRILEYYNSLKMNNIVLFNAKNDFLDALKGVKKPEEKRNIIGKLFLSIQDRAFKEMKLNSTDFILAQGTIYPDTIESGGSKHAETIKTHHNQVPLAKAMIRKGLLIEPLAELYKDEVRALGRYLGMPSALLERHPFPGPGLAVRLLCQSKPGRSTKRIALLNQKLKTLIPAGFQGAILPVKSVGVQGDKRSFTYCAAIAGPKNWKQIEKVSIEITNTVADINRVVYCCDTKAIPRISGCGQTITESLLQLLQDCDKLAHDIIRDKELYAKIWQMPVILLPLEIESRPVICIRPVESREAMTATFFKMPFRVLQGIRKKMMDRFDIAEMLYDVTHKPPATIEWE